MGADRKQALFIGALAVLAAVALGAAVGGAGGAILLLLGGLVGALATLYLSATNGISRRAGGIAGQGLAAIGQYWLGSTRQGATATPGAAVTWQSLLVALPHPAIVVDVDLAIVDANGAARALYPALKKGQPVTLVSRAPEFQDVLVRVVSGQEPGTVRLLERIPLERRIDVAAAPLAGTAPGEPRVLLVLQDVSERDRLAQMRTDFIAHASHELRTPLAAVKGFIETLQGAAKDDPVARERFLAIMAGETGRMSRLLDDLLSLSRLEMRAHLPPTGQFEINELLARVRETMAPVAAEAGATLEVATLEHALTIPGDGDEIMQVFTNLVQNAIKYGRDGGKVWVRPRIEMRGSDRRLWVEVTDDGPGIAEKHIPRLVERFYRADESKRRDKAGTGLGLAIVKHVLVRHGGELQIRSVLGEGSTFSVDLPVPGSESNL